MLTRLTVNFVTPQALYVQDQDFVTIRLDQPVQAGRFLDVSLTLRGDASTGSTLSPNAFRLNAGENQTTIVLRTGSFPGTMDIVAALSGTAADAYTLWLHPTRSR